MGLFSFIKDAGEKLFGTGKAAAASSSGSAAASVDQVAVNDKAAAAIAAYIQALKIAPADLQVTFDGASETVTVTGTAPDQATRERILLAAGNVQGVGSVNDQMTVEHSEPEARFHTVAKGETLSAIAKTHYGNANKYMLIFEANKPMLSHPDKIYPGQMLRIPAEG